MSIVRNNWTFDEIAAIYHKPLLDLIYEAATVHREHKNYAEVQISSLVNIKSGGCPEDCAYCPQAARYHTEIDVHALLKQEEVLATAKQAKEAGVSRMCLGAAWREVRDNRDFDRVLDMVRGINDIGMEVCCTLGMLTYEQAQRLAEAGLYAYNHNIDTSSEHYSEIITTRTIDDRLKTLDHVRKANLTICSGGIVGLGEKDSDRINMLLLLANLPKHPESVPINALVPVQGTPLENQPRVPFHDMVRMIATTRLVLSKSVVRLSAGRREMSMAEQALCFMAGANSIFAGDKLLTTDNPSFEEDMNMFELLGLTARKPFKDVITHNHSEHAQL